MGLVYRVFWRNSLDKLIISLVAVLAVLAIAVFLALDWDAVGRVLQDPEEFSGRSAIWQGEVAFVRDHPWLGAGFGSFADTGALSPLFNYVGANWVQNAAHGHNAYLQIFVTVGGVGFALALLSFVIGPAISFWRADPRSIELTSMLFAIFVFMLLHNFLESDFLEGDSPAWVAFLLMLGLLRLTRDSSMERAP
jgi:O-antigen ligase